MNKILVACSDSLMKRIIQQEFEKAGYQVVTTNNILTAKDCMFDFDLCVTDQSNLLKGTITIPYIAIVDDAEACLDAFSKNADDCLIKPFSVKELATRVKTILKRTQANTYISQHIVRYNTIKLDIWKQLLTFGNSKSVNLTRTEINILSYLLKNPYQAISEKCLLEVSQTSSKHSEIVRTYICRLRKKLYPHLFINTHKRGKKNESLYYSVKAI